MGGMESRTRTKTMTIWLLIMFLHGEPKIIDYYDTKQECEAAILADWQCVEGTVVKNNLNEWDLRESKESGLQGR